MEKYPLFPEAQVQPETHHFDPAWVPVFEAIDKTALHKIERLHVRNLEAKKKILDAEFRMRAVAHCGNGGGSFEEFGKQYREWEKLQNIKVLDN